MGLFGSWSDFTAGIDRILPGGDDPWGSSGGIVYEKTVGEAFGATWAEINPAYQLFGAVLPGTADSFGTGLARIIGGTVGEGDNPSWAEAWDETARELPDAGLLPGGEPPADLLKDVGKWIIGLAVAAGALLLGGTHD